MRESESRAEIWRSTGSGLRLSRDRTVLSLGEPCGLYQSGHDGWLEHWHDMGVFMWVGDCLETHHLLLETFHLAADCDDVCTAAALVRRADDASVLACVVLVGERVVTMASSLDQWVECGLDIGG